MLFQKTTYRAPRKIILVQIHLEQQELHIRYTTVARKLSDLPEHIHWTSVETAEELVKKAGKGTPYVIHLTGFGVLARIAENAPNYKEGLLVNGGEDDFYFSCYELKSTVGVSFIRRSLIDSFLETLGAQKVFIWGIHTGPVPLLQLAGENGSLQLDYLIETSNGDIRKLERNTGEVKRFGTAGGFFNTDAAYVHSIARLTFEPNENYHQGFSEERQQQTRNDFKEYTQFVRIGVGILVFFLTTLTGNYFYVNHLNDVAAQLEADISGYGENLALTDRLEQEKQRKLVLVENSGIQSSKYVSFYLDEIGSSVPASIQLSSLETFPLTEPLKPKRKVELNIHHITITGFSGNSKVLDDWMEALERKKWINSVELINYVRIYDQKATFHLLVKISE